MTRKERRQREAAGEFNTDHFGSGKAAPRSRFRSTTTSCSTPSTALRVNGAADRSFDNAACVVDDGETVKLDFQLFFKHERLGAIAPCSRSRLQARSD